MLIQRSDPFTCSGWIAGPTEIALKGLHLLTVPTHLSGEEVLQSLHVTFKDLKQNILYGVDPTDIATLASVILLPVADTSTHFTSPENRDGAACS